MKMKILYTRVILLIMTLGVFVACEDDDIPGASYQSGVWFYASAATFPSQFDSIAFDDVFSGTYTFYFHQGVETDTFALPEIRLMGVPADYDRKVNLVAGEGTTAVEGEQFEIIDAILPAHAVSFVPRVLLKKNNLGDEEKVIKFVLEPSDEFPAQVFADTVADDRTFLISLRYELIFSDLEMEPPYWNQTSFKQWSKVKYEFMREHLDRDWGVEPLSSTDMNEMYNDVLYMRYQLQLWKNANGGKNMLDENGNRITF